MSWMAAAFVFLSLFLQLNHGGGTGLAHEWPPTIQTSSPRSSPIEFDPGNPLDMLVMSRPNELRMIFGMEFINEVRMIKNDCEWKEYIAETELQRERQEILNYKENIDELMNEQYFKDLPPDEQNQVRNSAQVAYDNLVRKESNRGDKLARECNIALMTFEDERMADALNFAKEKLMVGISAFANYVNQVDDYGLAVESALTDCLNTYAHELLSRYYMVRLSPSEICMQVEVEILVRFINEFVVRASQLVISYSDDEDFDSLTSGSGSIERVPSRIPESFPRPDTEFNPLPQEPDTMEETETVEPDTDNEVDGQNNEPFDSDFDNPDQDYEPIPSPVSHEYTEQIGEELLSAIASYHAKDKPRPTQLPSHKSSILTPQPSPVVGGGTDRSGSKDSAHNQGNEFTRLQPSGRPTRPNAGEGDRPGALARPAISAKPKRPIPYQRPGRPESGISQRPIRPLARPLQPNRKSMLVNRPSLSLVPAEQHTLGTLPSNVPTPSAEKSASQQEQGHSTLVVMIVFGSTAVILVFAIIILAVFIGITKYRTARKGWTKLTEQEKVDLMKQSGYVNPTYQFFDRVTQ